MAFTYNLTGTGNALLISKVRLELGDNVYGSGVRPASVNFTDEEISAWLTEEADDIQAVVGRAAQALANMWASAAVSKSAGPYSVNYGKISDIWAARAAEHGLGVAGDVSIETGTVNYDFVEHGDDPEMIA
jgi:hypothetical protein